MVNLEFYFTELDTKNKGHEFQISKLKFFKLLYLKYGEIYIFSKKLVNIEY